MKPTIDRKKVEALVREALAREIGAEQAAARDVESAGALLIPPDRGVNIGEPYDPRVMPGILQSTPARIAVGRTGPRYRTNTMLRFRADHAAAKDAVVSEVEPARLAELGLFELTTRAPDKPTFLQRPDLGRALSDEARTVLAQKIGRAPTLVIIYGDGLSATAINQHLATFHQALLPALAARGIAHAPAFFVRRSRVKVMDEIARLCGAQAALFVCGERPGLGFADSMSAYYIYQPAAGATDADREVISNINPRGRPPADAARDVAAAIERILREKKSGVVLAGG
ncbi:MAG TPA: ethanolamine ammonia-lyase subunit EutC [Polyangia bacterium]|nr:ethanolamine ammonia-lyase subunit EutC [Polyangia bacterium]